MKKTSTARMGADRVLEVTNRSIDTNEEILAEILNYARAHLQLINPKTNMDFLSAMLSKETGEKVSALGRKMVLDHRSDWQMADLAILGNALMEKCFRPQLSIGSKDNKENVLHSVMVDPNDASLAKLNVLLKTIFTISGGAEENSEKITSLCQSHKMTQAEITEVLLYFYAKCNQEMGLKVKDMIKQNFVGIRQTVANQVAMIHQVVSQAHQQLEQHLDADLEQKKVLLAARVEAAKEKMYGFQGELMACDYLNYNATDLFLDQQDFNTTLLASRENQRSKLNDHMVMLLKEIDGIREQLTGHIDAATEITVEHAKNIDILVKVAEPTLSRLQNLLQISASAEQDSSRLAEYLDMEVVEKINASAIHIESIKTKLGAAMSDADAGCQRDSAAPKSPSTLFLGSAEEVDKVLSSSQIEQYLDGIKAIIQGGSSHDEDYVVVNTEVLQGDEGQSTVALSEAATAVVVDRVARAASAAASTTMQLLSDLYPPARLFVTGFSDQLVRMILGGSRSVGRSCRVLDIRSQVLTSMAIPPRSPSGLSGIASQRKELQNALLNLKLDTHRKQQYSAFDHSKAKHTSTENLLAVISGAVEQVFKEVLAAKDIEVAEAKDAKAEVPAKAKGTTMGTGSATKRANKITAKALLNAMANSSLPGREGGCHAFPYEISLGRDQRSSVLPSVMVVTEMPHKQRDQKDGGVGSAAAEVEGQQAEIPSAVTRFVEQLVHRVDAYLESHDTAPSNGQTTSGRGEIDQQDNADNCSPLALSGGAGQGRK